jgi:hypothetical protein
VIGPPNAASPSAAARPVDARPVDPQADAEFAALVADVADAIEHTVPGWRARLGEAAARWRAEGVRTAVLERALALPHDPGTDALVATFASTVERLRALERVAAATDPGLAGAECFRDPERLRDAAATVARAQAAAAAAAQRPAPTVRAPAARHVAVHVDCERWVRTWPSSDPLLVEDHA